MTETKNLVQLDNNTFYSTIENGLTLVDFWAEWCMPCLMQAPILAEAASTLGDRAVIAKLNVDHYPDIAGKYGITGIPTMILFKDGAEVKRFVGVQSRNAVTDAVEKAGA